MTSAFNRQHLAFSLLFAVLISAATLPVIGLHYVKTLSGSTAAVLAVVGLLVSDCVMMFSTWWSVRGPGALVRVVAMCVKYLIAVCAILTAAVVLVSMRYDQQADHATAQASAVRLAEIEARKAAAIDISKATGNRQAVREMVRMDSGSIQPPRVPSSPLPDWVTSFGVFILLPLVSILGAMALSISASIADPASGDLTPPVSRTQPLLERDVEIVPSFPANAKKISGRRK